MQYQLSKDTTLLIRIVTHFSLFSQKFNYISPLARPTLNLFSQSHDIHYLRTNHNDTNNKSKEQFVPNCSQNITSGNTTDHHIWSINDTNLINKILTSPRSKMFESSPFKMCKLK